MNRCLPAVWILFAWMPVSAAPNCVTDADCLKPGWVCEFPVGDCAQQNGTCHSAPTCDSNSGPVCGCDDNGFGPTTYADACAAFDAGDVVAALGACPISCGGQTCAGNTFCQLPPGVCNRGVPQTCPWGNYGAVQERLYATAGICTPVPTSCPPDDEPVCACDLSSIGPGTTYLNSCVAAQNQESVFRDGPCYSGGGSELCGGFGGFVCSDPNDVCVYIECPLCGFDLQGACEPRPVTCDNTCVPVCDCSDGWYRNRCEWVQAEGIPWYPLTLGDLAGCGEVAGVQFLAKNELRWWTFPGNPPRQFNVYRSVLTGGQPPSWDCVASGLAWHPHVVSGTPAAGEFWGFAVTLVDAGIEGPLGWGGSGCTERTNVVACPQ